MRRKKGLLRFLRSEGAWVIFTSSENYIRVHKKNIVDFGLEKNNHYYRSFYEFNPSGELCVWLNEHKFCLDKFCDYEVLYQPVIED